MDVQEERGRWQYLFILLLLMVAHQAYGEQHFTRHPESIHVNQGQTVILQCTVAQLQGRVQWTKNNFGLGYNLTHYPRYTLIGLHSRGEYNLMISNVRLDDDGFYECQVTATTTARGIRSQRAKVTIRNPCDQPLVDGAIPMEDTSRKRVEVVADTPFNLTCTAPNGRPAANVTWFKDDELAVGETYSSISIKDKLQDATVALNVTAKRLERPVYECRAQNDAMLYPKVQAVELDVLYAPMVSISANPSGDLRESRKVTFTCTAMANPDDNITWKWFLDSKEIEGATSSSYTLEALGREHHGKKIACEATNKVDSARTQHLLSVQYSPRFKEPVRHAAVDLGDAATLTCEVDSNPSAAVVWRRKGEANARIIGNDKSLTITKVAPQHLGVYTCSVSLLDFDQISAEVHILKKGPPQILSPPQQWAKLSWEAVVECRVNSVPYSKVMWTRDDKDIDFSVLPRYKQKEEQFPGEILSTIVISAVQESDFGQFNCSIENGYGSDLLTITLSKQAVIPLVYILASLLIGLVVIIAVSVAIFVYHRRKKAIMGEGSSQGSEDSTAKKPVPDISPPYKPYVDTWRPDYEPRIYRQSADYDELSYPHRDGRRSANPYEGDYPDSYGNNGYERDYRRDYGTYPGPAPYAVRSFDPRFEAGPYGPPVQPYGPPPLGVPSDYLTYNRAPSRQAYTPVTSVSPPPSRLSTNV